MTTFRRDDLPRQPRASAEAARDRMIARQMAAGSGTLEPLASGLRRDAAASRLVSAEAARDAMIRRMLGF